MGLPIDAVIINGIQPTISVVMPNTGISAAGITYQQFLNSLGKYNYGVNFFYLAASSIQQVGVPVYYRRFDSNGNAISTFLPFAVDPYQSQPSMYYQTNEEEIIFTGLSYIEVPILPNQRVYFKCFTTIAYMGNELDDKGSPSGDNLFEEIEASKDLNFFEDYCNYLIDVDNGN
jgi:hypothetical protein